MTTLLERIGGQDDVTAAVDLFYIKVLQDPQLAPFFSRQQHGSPAPPAGCFPDPGLGRKRENGGNLYAQCPPPAGGKYGSQ